MHWTTGKIYRPIPNTCMRMVQGHRGHAGSMRTKIPPYLLSMGVLQGHKAPPPDLEKIPRWYYHLLRCGYGAESSCSPANQI